jgi:hypothetical protein
MQSGQSPGKRPSLSRANYLPCDSRIGGHANRSACCKRTLRAGRTASRFSRVPQLLSCIVRSQRAHRWMRRVSTSMGTPLTIPTTSHPWSMAVDLAIRWAPHHGKTAVHLHDVDSPDWPLAEAQSRATRFGCSDSRKRSGAITSGIWSIWSSPTRSPWFGMASGISESNRQSPEAR